MLKQHPEQSLEQIGESVMHLVTQVAGRRLTMILQFIHEDKIKPLETENKRLRALLRTYGIQP